MTKDLFTGPLRSPRDISSALKWKNTSGEIIPAYACVKLESYDEELDLYNAVKPDGEGDLYFVNGPIPISANSYSGSQLWNQSRIGLTSSITFGTQVGPVADSWEMDEGGSGFVVFSTPTDGIAAILKLGGGGGGGNNSLWGTVDEVVCDPYGDPLEMYCWVEVTDFSGGCTATIPGEDSYTGLVQVFQKCDTFTAYYTAEQLIGKTIEAGYYYPRTGDCAPRWIVRQVCGEPQCS